MSISSIDTSIKFEITMGDDSQVKALGKGLVYVLTKQDQKKDIHDAYYVPNLKHNMISVRKSMEHGYDVMFKASTCLILDKPPGRKLIEKLQMTKKMMFPLYLRSVNLSQSYAQNISNSDENLLWHANLGYLPFRSPSLLQKHSMVKGLLVLNEQDNPCKICILGKHK
jgi:hypothetical protein